MLSSMEAIFRYQENYGFMLEKFWKKCSKHHWVHFVPWGSLQVSIRKDGNLCLSFLLQVSSLALSIISTLTTVQSALVTGCLGIFIVSTLTHIIKFMTENLPQTDADCEMLIRVHC